jgi:hypothetical protein
LMPILPVGKHSSLCKYFGVVLMASLRGWRISLVFSRLGSCGDIGGALLVQWSPLSRWFQVIEFLLPAFFRSPCYQHHQLGNIDLLRDILETLYCQ